MSSRAVRISVGDVVLDAELNESETAERVYRSLPIQGAAQRWGEEIYFEIPVDADEAADARDRLEVGELAYWPPGRAFCIFFGPTPASSAEEPRAASPVNPLGRVAGDASVLTRVASGTEVTIEPV
jgi:hypothetical protein